MLENPRIEVIGFDLDNTLYSSTPEIQSRIRGGIYHRLSEEFGISFYEAKELFEENYRGSFPWSYSGSRTVEEIARRFKKQLDGSDIIQQSAGQADILCLLEPDPAVQDMLTRLGEKRELDLITSSKYHLALDKLKRIGIPFSLFRNIISTEFHGSKSDGTVYKFWLSLREIPPNQVLYVGDNPKQDIEIPRRLGIRTCYLGEKEVETDFKISKILELEQVLSEIK